MVDTSSIRDALSLPRWNDPLVLYVAVTFLVSWPLWLAAVLVPGLSATTVDRLLAVALLGPAAGTLITLRLRGESLRAWTRQRVLRPLSPRWLVLIPLVAFGVEFLRVGLLASIPPFGLTGAYPADPSGWWDLAVATFLSTSFFAGVEEFGWRGYALPRLQERHGALAASITLGLIWTAWHLPTFVNAHNAALEFVGFLSVTVAMSVVFTWFFNATGGNVWAAFLYHGLHNAALDLVAILVFRGPVLSNLASVAAVALVAAYPVYRYGPTTLSPTGLARPVDES